MVATAQSSSAFAGRSCLHCGLPVDGARRAGFCCSGCQAVYGLLHSEHLDAYYGFRGARGVPITDRHVERRDTKWLEAVEARLRAGGGHARVTLDVQGLHCVGCVWLIDELFGRARGGERIVVNPSLGRVDLFARSDFDLRAFIAGVERFGYLFGPPVKSAAPASADLLWRMGVCVAIAMNSMIFAIAMYAGLDRGPLFTLFTTLNLGLGAVAVLVGGTVFFRSAWRATAAGVLHLDLPIALGIALAFAGSVQSYVAHRSQAAYFDTLDVFIALMLLGRWLQERVIERNRAWLLASDGTEGLLARRMRGDLVELVACKELREGDALLIAPGDLVPVDARVEGRSPAVFSLDWINGESRPRSYGAGDVVPAGAFSVGAEAVLLDANTDFEASSLRELLRAPIENANDRARATSWWQRLARVYIASVLLVAAGGFVAWWTATHDVSRAVSVATAVLIVTCPCAFGIATPLAYEMVQAALRRRGLFVRRSSFLDRAREVRHIVFDKTGTLTTGALAVSNPRAIDLLPIAPRRALYDMVARSSHPKSAALRDVFDSHAALDATARVVERAGLGLELERDGRIWRVGDARWACSNPEEAASSFDVVLSADSVLVAGFHTTERLRSDARREVDALTSDGYDVSLLSGDAQPRVDAAAAACGLPSGRAFGARDPRAKARFLDQHDAAHTLFVGDGVNDALALDHALVSGTPAVDRPFVPARADFFFVTPGLAPIRLALRSARVLAQVVHFDLTIALAYNAITVALALAGRMSPLACAVLMPASSLTTIAVTVAALSPRSRLWRS
jgi:Cu2+-exporting ATPase